MADKLDIIIFGATGFTGKNTILSVDKLAETSEKKFTWGVAGRSEKKLQDVLAEASQKLGKDLTAIPIIIADVGDYDSLTKMTTRARVIVNTCGPYRFFGEPVVKACVETGTHHVDVSGEPQYMENMQLKYHKEAAEKGIYIVSACGYDSIPTDLGIVSLMETFDGTLNSVETYMESGGNGISGAAINYGTWESAVHGLANYSELRQIRGKLFPNKLPELAPKLKSRGSIHKSEVTNGWAVPFLGSDRSVALRTQRYFHEEEKKRPIQVQTYLSIDSMFHLIIMGLFAGVFLILSKFEMGRKLLLNYPGIFSGGFISRDGPSDEAMNNTKYSITLVGKGWSKDTPSTDGEFDVEPNLTKTIKVSGKNPGYGLTCDALTISALTILRDASKMPKKGGVYSPGAAFGHTSLLKEVVRSGMKLEVV